MSVRVDHPASEFRVHVVGQYPAVGVDIDMLIPSGLGVASHTHGTDDVGVRLKLDDLIPAPHVIQFDGPGRLVPGRNASFLIQILTYFKG